MELKSFAYFHKRHFYTQPLFVDSIKLGSGRRGKHPEVLCWAAFDPTIRTSEAADAASEEGGENLLKQIWASR